MLSRTCPAFRSARRPAGRGSRVPSTPRAASLPGRLPSIHSTAHSGDSVRIKRRRPAALLSALAAGGLGLAYLFYSDHREDHNQAGIATQNVRFRRRIPRPATSTVSNTTKDSLLILDPAELAASTAHLVDLPLSQLMRAYIVFLASSSPFLVDIAPATIEKAEWLRENLPFGLGKPIWGLLVFVSYSDADLPPSVW